MPVSLVNNLAAFAVLGSASLLVNSSNNPVAGSRTWYLPFGGYRPGSAPTQTITDRDFTDQRENMELGLLYYGARFYVPGLGRFASADSIIPNPANPQSYNRYSYVRNSPLNRVDPTGHVDCGLLGDSSDIQACNNAAPPNLVKFTGDNWTDEEKSVIRIGAWQVALALYWASDGQFGSPSETFRTIYGGAVTFNKTGEECAEGCYGRWSGNNTINIYNDIYEKNKDGTYDFTKSRIPNVTTADRWAIHELGHGFEAKVNDILGGEHIRNNLPADIANRAGFAGPAYGWQQSECTIDCNGEIFADMFVGWTYRRWETDSITGRLTDEASLKSNYMTTNMSVWINIVGQR